MPTEGGTLSNRFPPRVNGEVSYLLCICSVQQSVEGLYDDLTTISSLEKYCEHMASSITKNCYDKVNDENSHEFIVYLL